MAVKPVSRGTLVTQILDAGLSDEDRAIAARALVRNFPSVLKTFNDVLGLVLRDGVISPDAFDICRDAWVDARGRQRATVKFR